MENERMKYQIFQQKWRQIWAKLRALLENWAWLEESAKGERAAALKSAQCRKCILWNLALEQCRKYILWNICFGTPAKPHPCYRPEIGGWVPFLALH